MWWHDRMLTCMSSTGYLLIYLFQSSNEPYFLQKLKKSQHIWNIIHPLKYISKHHGRWAIRLRIAHTKPCMLLMIYSNKIREIKTKSPSFKYATYVERQRHLLVRGVFENQKRYVEVEKNTGVFELTCDVCPCLCGRYIVGV